VSFPFFAKKGNDTSGPFSNLLLFPARLCTLPGRALLWCGFFSWRFRFWRNDHIVNRHDHRRSRIDSKFLKDRHQCFSECVKSRLGCPDIEHCKIAWAAKSGMINAAALMAATALLQTFDAFVVRTRRHWNFGREIEAKCHKLSLRNESGVTNRVFLQLPAAAKVPLFINRQS